MANDTAVGTLAWSNPGNVASSNDTYAKAGPTSGQYNSNYLKCTNFGFAIDSGATINGVSVAIERRTKASESMDTYVQDVTVKLVKGGTVSGNNKGTYESWPYTEAVKTFGGASDLWGLTLTPSDVNASNFGVVFQMTLWDYGGYDGNEAWVDYVTITITYTLAASGAPRQMMHTARLRH
jgi:hypothetical protein